MKKTILITLALCFLLAGCSQRAADTVDNKESEVGSVATDMTARETPAPVEESEPALTVYSLPDTTMENLTDAILSVSLAEGDAYVDDTGKMQMKVKIYTYDLYDAKDIAQLKAGDTIVRHAGEIKVSSVERSESGFICINGGLENGGFELTTSGGGVFYEIGFNDIKNWYEVGEATIRVSVDFIGYDNADPEQGEVILYPGSFLVGEVTDYNFTPYNTTIRIEAGQIVELIRSYVP